MDSNTFDARLRELEYFHSLRCLTGAWIVLRLDGRGFTKFTARAGFEKPFDLQFQNYMRITSQTLLTELQGMYAFTESDEISILFHRHYDLYDREVEKLVSLSASIAGSTFSLASKHPAYFDSRIWLGVNVEQVVDYFRWRQDDASRCALNGWCHWTLLKDGKSPAQAMETLSGKTQTFKIELLAQRGIVFEQLPLWQQYGTGFYWETYQKSGYNPVQQIETVTLRRHIKINENLPAHEEYGVFIREQFLTEQSNEL